ncbi:cytochrome c4 [Marinobacterium sp. AK62]|uniref:Cytochrome c4 n=1 Tax=Marinobacterium alkalitolerans TaxID=1542925 RepID=A0ABS3ZA79_9GAMM|nr:c-type cytochrome [Marinobacterium alkalitolerans]MBP0048611.1 cytochrome c4 [Marinobacterium alkalitolerans]
MLKLNWRLALASAALCSSVVQAQGVVADGQQVAMKGDGSGAPCLACHGMDGAGNNAAGFPKLAGLDADYIAKQIRDYNAGTRVSGVMQPNVDNLTEQQILDVSAYYASLPSPDTAVEAEASLLASGKVLATRGDWDHYIPACESCHGPDSQGMGASFPALAGQHPTYIKQQLNAWRNGSRHNDPNQLMTGVAERLTEQQIEAVAAYLGSLSAKAGGQ